MKKAPIRRGRKLNKAMAPSGREQGEEAPLGWIQYEMEVAAPLPYSLIFPQGLFLKSVFCPLDCVKRRFLSKDVPSEYYP